MDVMDECDEKWDYVFSSELNANMQIKICTLEGKLDRPSFKKLADDPMLTFSGRMQPGCADFYVTCQVFSNSRALCPPIATAYRSFTTRWNWNQWLTLPVKLNELPRNSLLALTVWDVYGCTNAHAVGGTVVSIFGKHGKLRTGMHDLRLWSDVEADGSDTSHTLGKLGSNTAVSVSAPSASAVETSGASRANEQLMANLAKLTKRHRLGQMAQLDWLDRLTFREIELINEKEKRQSNFMYLMVEFPKITWQGASVNVVYNEPGPDSYQFLLNPDMVTIQDPGLYQENLVEMKHHQLARSLRSTADRDLKPNAEIRDQLKVIVDYPPAKVLTSEEKDLVWKFRFYLSNEKKALAKFLKSVNWWVVHEARQAIELMIRWNPMDVGDALELLSPSFTQTAVRKYAVARLRQASDEELLLYLLQLVQALKYEDADIIMSSYRSEAERSLVDSLHETQQQQHQSVTMDPTSADDPVTVAAAMQASLQELPGSQPSTPSEETAPVEMRLESMPASLSRQSSTMNPEELDLATFLIQRACNNIKVLSYLWWYITVECDEPDATGRDQRAADIYGTMLKRIQQAIQTGLEFHAHRNCILGQQALIQAIVSLVKVVDREGGNRQKKIERLQMLLRDPNALKFSFTDFSSVPLPLDPNVITSGIMWEKATLFKSALMPCRFHFRTHSAEHEYVTIFKHGDDLRQDQLILQMIMLMDQLLRKENLDLRLTPYKVLATGTKHGFVQFIESVPVSEVIRNDGSIVNFLRKQAPSDTAPLGIASELMDNYVRSCAGYCVITYLLGVGDRHMDNLLLTRTGKLFHIDFGFILGRDPKPMPPPMRLTREMVDAMGGTSSELFTDFKKLCYTAFLHLRRASNLILNLFSLMVDTTIPDIAIEPDKTVKKLQDRFCLDLSDEAAVHYMQNIIDISLTATMAAIMEQMHKLAQYLKK